MFNFWVFVSFCLYKPFFCFFVQKILQALTSRPMDCIRHWTKICFPRKLLECVVSVVDLFD